ESPFHFTTEQRELIRHFFTQRRKQISSLVNKHPTAAVLQPWLDALAKIGVATTARPEAIPLEAWKMLPTI
ncbi:MAG: 16S rRNA (adenine(1518)-N(6)/adenine(1519)-N(6))-dimethyltransferase RsmA, partial [Puniceicoccales bacterium]